MPHIYFSSWIVFTWEKTCKFFALSLSLSVGVYMFLNWKYLSDLFILILPVGMKLLWKLPLESLEIWLIHWGAMLVPWFSNLSQAKTFWVNACPLMTIWLKSLLNGLSWPSAVPFQFRLLLVGKFFFSHLKSLHAYGCVELGSGLHLTSLHSQDNGKLFTSSCH